MTICGYIIYRLTYNNVLLNFGKINKKCISMANAIINICP